MKCEFLYSVSPAHYIMNDVVNSSRKFINVDNVNLIIDVRLLNTLGNIEVLPINCSIL